MQLDIISPDKKIYSGEVELVQLPGISGSFEVLNNHAPLISILQQGKIKVIDSQKTEQCFYIKGGVVEVKANKTIILAE